jgi:hypothetical protein
MDTIRVLAEARKLVAESWNPIPKCRRTKPEETIEGKYCVVEAVEKVGDKRFFQIGNQPAMLMFKARFELYYGLLELDHQQTLKTFDRAIELAAPRCPSSGQVADSTEVKDQN